MGDSLNINFKIFFSVIKEEWKQNIKVLMTFSKNIRQKVNFQNERWHIQKHLNCSILWRHLN